jgi:hypothetical protein
MNKARDRTRRHHALAPFREENPTAWEENLRAWGENLTVWGKTLTAWEQNRTTHE